MKKDNIFPIFFIILFSQLLFASCIPAKTPSPTLTPTRKYYSLINNDTSWQFRIWKSDIYKSEGQNISAKEGYMFIFIYFKCPCTSIPNIPKEKEKTYLQDKDNN